MSETALQTSPPTALEKPATKPATLRDLLEGDSFKLQVAKALPKHLTPDRFIRVACTAMSKTPKLADCDRASFFSALLTLSQLGLEPDGRRAHLIPYGTTCQLIIDYKGLVELALRAGNVSTIHADKVCDADVFEVDRGSIVKHTINFKAPRGKSYAYYCLIKFKDGGEKAEVMTRDEVELIRKRSRAGSSGPWVTDFDEMGKKTVFRRASKWITLSPEIVDALDNDADGPAIDISPSPEIRRPKNLGPAPSLFAAGSGNVAEPEEAEVSELKPEVKPDPVSELRTLLATSKLTEAALVTYLHAEGAISDETLVTLDDVHAIQPDAITGAVDNWPSILATLKPAKPAKK